MKISKNCVFKRALIVLLVVVIIAQTGCNAFKNKIHCDKCSSLIEIVDRSNVDYIYVSHMYDSAFFPISRDQEEVLFATILNEIFITKDESIVRDKKTSMGTSSFRDVTISFYYSDGSRFAIFVNKNGDAICLDQNGDEYVICGNNTINIDLLEKI